MNKPNQYGWWVHYVCVCNSMAFTCPCPIHKPDEYYEYALAKQRQRVLEGVHDVSLAR